jgi:hypothetical protein
MDVYQRMGSCQNFQVARHPSGYLYVGRLRQVLSDATVAQPILILSFFFVAEMPNS